jgi:hypothetical protein
MNKLFTLEWFGDLIFILMWVLPAIFVLITTGKLIFLFAFIIPGIWILNSYVRDTPLFSIWQGIAWLIFVLLLIGGSIAILQSYGMFFAAPYAIILAYLFNHLWEKIPANKTAPPNYSPQNSFKSQNVWMLKNDGNNVITMTDIDKMEGVEFEKYLKKMFERMGYFVELTPHTSDMGADLILSKQGEKISVQAKNWANNVGNDAVMQVVGSLKFYKAQSGMVITSSDFTTAAKTLAHHNNVELWNREKLIEMMDRNPIYK